MKKMYIAYSAGFDLLEALNSNEFCSYADEKEMKEKYENDFEAFDSSLEPVSFVILDFSSKTIKSGKIEQTKSVKLVFDK